MNMIELTSTKGAVFEINMDVVWTLRTIPGGTRVSNLYGNMTEVKESREEIKDLWKNSLARIAVSCSTKT